MTEFKQGGLYEDARGEKFRISRVKGSDWVYGHRLRDPIDEAHEFCFRFDVAEMIFRPIEEPPKKKRLMTPAECAGKWMVSGDLRFLVTEFSSISIYSNGSQMSLREAHKSNWMIADTPTSTPYSLEIEEST